MATLALSIGTVDIPTNVPLVQEELVSFMPAQKRFLNGFSGLTVSFLGNRTKKMKGQNTARPTIQIDKNMAFCDTPQATSKYGIPEFFDVPAFYNRNPVIIDACSIEPLVDAELATAKSWADWNNGIIDPYVAMHLMQQTALLIGEKGWSKMQDYYLGHLSAADAAFSITNMPGASRIGTMSGIIGQVAVKMAAAGRTINNTFGQTALTTDSVIDEMEAQLAKQGIGLSAATGAGTPFYWHMTFAASQNYGQSLLRLGNNTNLLQEQTISGATYAVDSYRGIPIIVHPEWDEVLIADGLEPNMILLANKNQIKVYAPNPAIAPAGVFPFVISQDFVPKSGTLDKDLIQEFEWWGGAIVGGEATGFELSF